MSMPSGSRYHQGPTVSNRCLFLPKGCFRKKAGERKCRRIHPLWLPSFLLRSIGSTLPLLLPTYNRKVDPPNFPLNRKNASFSP
jgi:hypothetical protein